MSHGIVVEHNETGTWYAVSTRNYCPTVHTKVRDLLPGETVIGYRPKRREPVVETKARPKRRGSNRVTTETK